MAREKAAHWAERYAMAASKPAGPKRDLPDTPITRWFEAWIADRDARGIKSTDRNRNHYQLQIRPSLGTKHVRDWTSDDLRKLSRECAVDNAAKLL